MIKASIIEDIAQEMVRQVYEERTGKIMKEIGDMLRPILWEDAPDCIKALKDTEYAEYLDLRRFFTVNISPGLHINVDVERGYPAKLYKKEIADPDILEAARNLEQLLEAKWKFRNQLVCALSNIRSIKKLKDEFPEAYDIYLKIYTIQIPKPGCDSIEKVRAELSKLSKEETCSQESQPKEEQ